MLTPSLVVTCRHNAELPSYVPFSSSAAVSAPAPQSVTPLYLGKKAVVVGAGPAGSAAAMFLARQGFSVDVGGQLGGAAAWSADCGWSQLSGRCDSLCAVLQVYERRPEPKLDAVDTGRAYIIIVIPRGQAALREVGDGGAEGRRSRTTQLQLMGRTLTEAQPAGDPQQ